MIYYVSDILQQASIHSIYIPTRSYIWYALKYHIRFEFDLVLRVILPIYPFDTEKHKEISQITND